MIDNVVERLLNHEQLALQVETQLLRVILSFHGRRDERGRTPQRGERRARVIDL